jgi:Ca2+-binding RTX toxin-like protein
MTKYQGNSTAEFINANAYSSVNAKGGHDTIWKSGGTPFAVIHGGSGTDTVNLSGSTSGVTISNGFAWSGPNYIDNHGISFRFDGIENFLGSNFGDKIFNNSMVSQYVRGLGGDDAIHGGELADRLYGDDGDDRLFGGQGSDWLDGGLGDDRLSGDQGNDYLVGGPGNDFLSGDIGADVLRGDAGLDILRGGADADVFSFNSERTGAGQETGDVFDDLADHIRDFESKDRIMIVGDLEYGGDTNSPDAGEYSVWKKGSDHVITWRSEDGFNDILVSGDDPTDHIVFYEEILI